jgi:gamma-glutamylcyclotransferase (GGCT)/AIG2-like uncharacterized protein YtfP
MTSDPSALRPGEHLLFAYDSLLKGEPEHDLLAAARPLGPARTEAGYQLVELGPTGGLLRGGTGDVGGELYAVDRATLAAIDVRRGHPLAHHRGTIRLSDGREAEAYLLADDQARGRRRVRSGDWRARFASPRAGAERLHDGGPLVGWARDRFRRG